MGTDEKIAWRAIVQLYEGFRGRAIAALALTVLASALEAIALASLLPLINQFADSTSTSAVTDLIESVLSFVGLRMTPGQVVVVVAVLFALRGAAEFAATYLQQSTAERHRLHLIEEFFAAHRDADWGYTSRIPVGHLLNTLHQETNAAHQLFTRVLNLATTVAYLLVFVIVAFLVSPIITLGSLLLIVVAAVVVAASAPAVARSGFAIVEANRGVGRLATQFLSGAKTLKAFNGYTEASSLVMGEARHRADAHVRSKTISAAVNGILQFVLVTLVVLLVLLASRHLTASIGQVGVVAAMMYRAAGRAQQLTVATELSEFLPSLTSLLAAHAELRGHASPNASAGSAAPEVVQTIRLEDLCFHYAGSDRAAALEDVNFEIPRGRTVGIAGRSGAGKSTITALLLGLLRPTSGAILVNGEDLSGFDATSWRARVGYVPQEPYLLDGSIRDNIAFFRPLDDTTVREAARLAHVDEFVRLLPDGFETPVGDNGVALSGGQRQRICLARAIAGSPDVLVLDEATSSLDTESERSIRTALRSLHDDMSIVLVAHRLSTLEDADHIVVLDQGRVVEQGSHRDLVAAGGRFQELLRAQQSDLL